MASKSDFILYKILRMAGDLFAEHSAFALKLSRRVALTREASVNNLAFSPIFVDPIVAIMASGSERRFFNPTLSAVGLPEFSDIGGHASGIVNAILADGSRMGMGGPRISNNNTVWIDSSLSLKPRIRDSAEILRFKIKHKDASDGINSWVENVTAGLKTKTLPPGFIQESTGLVFINDLYFKGTWDQKFCESKTIKSEFHLLDGSTSTQVPFMTTEEDQLISAYDGFKVLGLRYKRGEEGFASYPHINGYKMGREFSMYVLLPDKRDGLWGLWERLSSEPKFLDRYRPRLARVGKFKFPKFKVEFGLEVSELLKGMGLVLPFEDGGLIDAAEGSPINVSSIFHKSVVEVTEEGTAAADIPAVPWEMDCDLSPPLPTIVDFEADHPFIYLIREDISGAVLFVGHVLDPSMVDDE